MNKDVSIKVQVVRGFSILAVLCIHTCGNGRLGLLLRPVVNYAVAMFLFIAGYMTPIKIDNLQKFYKKRFSRILPPYIVWSIIYTAFHSNWKDFVYNLLTGQCCSIYYYLLVMMQLTLLVPLLLKMIQSKYWKALFLVTPAAILIQYILLFFERQLIFPWNANLFFVWLIFFYWGLCIKSGKLKMPQFRCRFIVPALLIQYAEAAFWYFIMNNYAMATTQIKISSMITSLAFIGICHNWIHGSARTSDSFVCRLLIWIGDISFGIYLIHSLILELASPLLSRFPFPANTTIVLFIAVAVIWIMSKALGKNITKFIGFR